MERHNHDKPDSEANDVLRELDKLVLNYLEEKLSVENSECVSLDIAHDIESNHLDVIGSLNKLTSFKTINMSSPFQHVSFELTDEGLSYKNNGTPEFRVLSFFKKTDDELSLDDVKKEHNTGEDYLEIGWKNALKLKLLNYNKNTKKMSLSNISNKGDTIHYMLNVIFNLDQKSSNEKDLIDIIDKEFKKIYTNNVVDTDLTIKEMKKRKLIVEKRIKYYVVTPGVNFKQKIKPRLADITQEMIINGTWENIELKPYNFFSSGLKPDRGSVHPLIEIMQEFKLIFHLMGFEEMPTDEWVENSFWNFDALFQPQDHPSRDAHDTFFLSDPEYSCGEFLPAEYVEKVKDVHEKGGYESLGWGYKWSYDVALKNIMRTHTTASSARMLYKLAQEYKQSGIFVPKRYFSIDRVFRNETLDATHLAEFHQVEGLICDIGLSLGSLMGILKAFYSKIGINEVKFKPAYNPYTEPSMEVFGYHPKLNEWIEIGNSGMFRPEMMKPMGFPDNVSVIAWGLSLERPTMIRYNIDNIRNLFGTNAYLDLV